MSTLGWIILAIVVVVLVVVIALVAKTMSDRRKRQQAEQANALRQNAQVHDSEIAGSRHQVTRAEAEAAVAKQQAEEAQQQAEAAREGLAHDEARREELLREADRLDPSVDHTADDYRPTPPATSGGAHAGTPVDETASASGDPGDGYAGGQRRTSV